jgi:hypothetical protein
MSGAIVATLKHDGWALLDAVFNRAGDRLMTSASDVSGTVRLWTSDGLSIGTPMAHGGSAVNGARFSGDQKRIVSWTRDSIHLWDAATQSQLVAPMRTDGAMHEAAFVSGDSQVLTWGSRAIQRWDVDLGFPVGSMLRHPGLVGLWLVGGSGRFVSSDSASWRLWDEPKKSPMKGAYKYLEASVITGSELDDASGIVVTTTAGRWGELREQYCRANASMQSICRSTQ